MADAEQDPIGSQSAADGALSGHRADFWLVNISANQDPVITWTGADVGPIRRALNGKCNPIRNKKRQYI